MAPKKTPTRSATQQASTSAKSKFVRVNTVNDNNESSGANEEVGESSTLGPSLPSSFISLMRGYGNSTHSIPTFSGGYDKFNSFINKLDNRLILSDLYKHLDTPNIPEQQNLALYLCISFCLEGEPFDLISNSAKYNGQLAYKLLKEKYLGNSYARKTKALTQLAQLEQGPNEDVNAFITRADVIISKLEQFKVFNDSSFYVIKVMQGLLPKFEAFKVCINSGEEIPDWNSFKLRLTSHDQLHKATSVPKVMNVAVNSVNNYVPTVQKNRKSNFKKYIKNPKCSMCFSTTHMANQCNSTKWCSFCNNASHDLSDCRNKNRNNFANSHRGRGSRGRGGRGNNNNGNRGRGNKSGQNRGRGQNPSRGNSNLTPAGGRGYTQPSAAGNFNNGYMNYQSNFIENIPNTSMFN